MKYQSIIVSFTMLLATTGLKAQDTIQTVFSKSGPQSITYFAGPEIRTVVQNSVFSEPLALFLGVRSGLIVNRHVVLGLGAYGKVTNSTYYDAYSFRDDNGQTKYNPSQKMRYSYGYGGAYLGYIFKPYKSVHFQSGLLIGGGSANEFIVQENGSHGTTFKSPGFFVLEPSFEMQFNLSRELRFSLGAHYHYADARYFESLDSREISHFGLQAAVTFGLF